MKTFKLLCLALTILVSYTLSAQVAITTDGSDPDGSAMLDVKSTEKGFLPPRMTQAQIEAITSPADGLTVFNTTDEKLYFFVEADNEWKEVQYGTGTITPNLPPVASNVSFSGTLEVGETLTGDYTYADNESDLEGTSTFQWYRADDASGTNQAAISGATALTYELVEADDAKYISFEVTPVAATGTSPGIAVMSDYGGPTFLCGISTITDVDDNSYNTVQIGTQCWMKENLKTTTYRNGTAIPNVTDNSAWSILTTGAYVWYVNDIGWKGSYGALYNWYATVDANGLCPSGWHVPSNAEWIALTDFIGGTASPHGNELKSCRQVNSPLGGDCNTTEHPRYNGNATNYGTDDYGFSGLPGGYCDASGTFNMMGANGYWWSSTASSAIDGWERFLYYKVGGVNVTINNKRFGFSVRCLRD